MNNSSDTITANVCLIVLKSHFQQEILSYKGDESTTYHTWQKVWQTADEALFFLSLCILKSAGERSQPDLHLQNQTVSPLILEVFSLVIAKNTV